MPSASTSTAPHATPGAVEKVTVPPKGEASVAPALVTVAVTTVPVRLAVVVVAPGATVSVLAALVDGASDAVPR